MTDTIAVTSARDLLAHDGHQIAVTARLRPEHAKTVLGIVEGDPLDQACENFLGR